MKKHEIAVFIENEEMLREAGDTLKSLGEKCDRLNTELYAPVVNYLRWHENIGWYLNTCFMKHKITLPQLEEILKNQ